MKFTIKKAPEVALATTSRNALGFPFEDLGVGECFFIPHKFWTEERGVKPADFDVDKMIARVKNAHITWKKANIKDEEERKAHRLGVVEADEDGEKGLYVTRLGVLGDVEEPAPEAEQPTEEKPTEGGETQDPAPTAKGKKAA